MSIQHYIYRRALKKWSRKNQPTQNTPLRICSRADIEEIRSLRLTLHVKTTEFEGYYHECELKASGNYDTIPTNTSLASERVAELIGLKNLIPNSEYLFLKIDDEPVKYGLMTEPSPGICVIAVSDKEARRSSISPSLQRSLNALHLLDTICFETDHHPNNYNVLFDDSGAAIGISSFDNNGEGSFRFSRKVCFQNNKGCSPLVNEEGFFNRPYLDADLVQTLSNLTFHEVWSALNRDIPSMSILFLWLRMTEMKRAIRRSLQSGAAQLLKKEEWSSASIEAELSGQYGKTYLHSFVEDCVVPEEKLYLSPYEKRIVETINNRHRVLGGSNQ